MANQTGVALTFADMAAATPNASKYIKGALTLLANEIDIHDKVPFINLGGQQSATVPRPNPDTIGTVYYRNVDGKYTFTKSSLEKFTEETKLLTYAFEIDTVTNNDPSFSLFRPGPTNLQLLAEQWSRELMDSLINGDPTVDYQTDPDSVSLRRPPGIKYRLKNALNGIDTSGYVDAGFDLTSFNSSTANDFVDHINEQISLINPTFMIANYKMVTKMQRAVRQGAMLDITRDQFGRTMANWAGVPIIIPKVKTAVRKERNLADTTTWVLPWEDNTGAATPTASAGSRYGSILYVRTSTTDGFAGLTINGMQQRGPEKLPLPAESVAYAMQYGYGWATLGLRCIGWSYDIKIG